MPTKDSGGPMLEGLKAERLGRMGFVDVLQASESAPIATDIAEIAYDVQGVYLDVRVF